MQELKPYLVLKSMFDPHSAKMFSPIWAALEGVFNFHKVNIKSLFWCPVRMVLEQN